MKTLTWKEVRDFLNKCSEEQLSQRAHIQVMDEPAVYMAEICHNEEDLVWNDEMDEGCIPVSEYNPEDYGEIPLDSDENIHYPKGSLIWAFDHSCMPDEPTNKQG